jgi:hypothetical protein
MICHTRQQYTDELVNCIAEVKSLNLETQLQVDFDDGMTPLGYIPPEYDSKIKLD